MTVTLHPGPPVRAHGGPFSVHFACSWHVPVHSPRGGTLSYCLGGIHTKMQVPSAARPRRRGTLGPGHRAHEQGAAMLLSGREPCWWTCWRKGTQIPDRPSWQQDIDQVSTWVQTCAWGIKGKRASHGDLPRPPAIRLGSAGMEGSGGYKQEGSPSAFWGHRSPVLSLTTLA